jgi:glucose/arabinose dehydrogenase
MVTNEVTIFRTTGTSATGDPADPVPWLHTSYPYGVGPFNHAVGNISTGPDGKLYVTSGSRTDGNESGKDPRYYPGGEVPLTACIWRLEPDAEKPEIEIFARGLRNAYGFCWNSAGEMFATDNGPDANAPEELNRIERDKHYGFPFQFSNWTNKPYAYTPNPPAGVTFTLPVANLGPNGGFNGSPIYTFDPHSSPAGVVYLGDDFPAAFRGTFLIARFGNLIAAPHDVGFDLLQGRVQRNAAGDYEGDFTTVLSPLGRPLDVHLAGRGKVYILEYSRNLDNKGDIPMLPGRVLELAVKGPVGR